MTTYIQYSPFDHQNRVRVWQKEWWNRSAIFTLLYSLIFFIFICAVLVPFGKFSEQQINGKSLHSSEQLEQDVRNVEHLLKEPVSKEAYRYFEILTKLSETESQCELFMELTKGSPVYPAELPCMRLRSKVFMSRQDLLNSYTSSHTNEQIVEARDRYSLEHPDWEKELFKGIHTTIYHPEQILIAYVNGAQLSILFFIVRLKQKGFNVYLEFFGLRFWGYVAIWTVSMFFYPGDNPMQQMKDRAKTFAYLIMIAVSCLGGVPAYAAAKAKNSSAKSKKDEDVTWSYSGYAQGLLDGKERNKLQEGISRLIISGKLSDWSARLEFGISRFDIENERYLRQAWVKYSNEDWGNIQFGRFFAAASWTTLMPSEKITALYPKADPSRGEAYGVQYSKTWNKVTVYAALTGLSGKSFVTDENFDGYELAERIEWQANETLSFALTGQQRPDVSWGSAEFQYTSSDSNVSVRGVGYGGRYQNGKGFWSGYVTGSYWWIKDFLNTHVMIDRGSDTQIQITSGLTWQPFENKHLRFIADAQYNLETNETQPKLLLQLAF